MSCSRTFVRIHICVRARRPAALPFGTRFNAMLPQGDSGGECGTRRRTYHVYTENGQGLSGDPSTRLYSYQVYMQRDEVV